MNNLWQILLEAISLKGEWTRAYNLVNTAYMQCLYLNTDVSGTVFVGPFAKTDYLLKEHGAQKELARGINNTRVRLRHRYSMREDEIQSHFFVDLRNVCRFIALVYGCEIPVELENVFPSTQAENEKEKRERIERGVTGRPVLQCVRIIVERFDSQHVYGHADMSDNDDEVVVALTTPHGVFSFDWSYISTLLYPGAQLNIIRPRDEMGVLYPEMIIVDPDNLVDVSAIARCFATYAESPLVHLINRISPPNNSEPILIGNLASQMLDEELHAEPDHLPSYADTVMEFYHHNALSLLAINQSKDFHNEAMRQLSNIAGAIHKSLPQALSRFNRCEVMVEPSFFCEMLGIQGRMDFLQLDHKVLLEQKSGKGDYDPHPLDPNTPKFREEHYVQMLLYMQILRYGFAEQYEANKRELHSFLLYSKYKNSLVGLGYSPELAYRAMFIRNSIVSLERKLADEKGYAILESLTPDVLNEKHISGRLWDEYVSKQLHEILDPLHHATPLERCYVERMLSFVSREHLLSKYGNMTKESSGFASKWHDSLDDKLHAGNIYCNLHLVSPDSESEGRISHVRLAFDESSSEDTNNFRCGDVVVLYAYDEGEEPDVRRTMVFRSSIVDITANEIVLKLRADQTDAHVFLRHRDKLWAIEHDFLESSFTTIYRGVYSLLFAPAHRRDLLLFQRTPDIDTSRKLKGDYGKFNTLSLRVKQARDFFLIIGPPGTGKTSFGMLNTLKEELLEPESHVLLTSYTNRAVDEICSKLLEEGIDFIRIGNETSCAPAYRSCLLNERVMQTKHIGELKEMLINCRVIVGTTSALSASAHMLFALKSFSLAIIDEASQILEPHLLGLLSATRNGDVAISRFVMIGDHKQLPAVVQQSRKDSIVSDDILKAIELCDCRLSLFERILHRYGNDDSVQYMLTRQGRMHRDIAMFPNLAFYDGRLEVVPLPHQLQDTTPDDESVDTLDRALFHRRISFIDVPAPQRILSDKVNPHEAQLIAQMVLRVYQRERESFNAAETIGIIVPYRNQIAAIRQLLHREHIPELHDITIDTVERYQGSQRKYIIYGFTVQRQYQLQFLTSNNFTDANGNIIDRKLNVAMTRAKEHLVMVGSKSLLAHDTVYHQLLQYLENNSR